MFQWESVYWDTRHKLFLSILSNIIIETHTRFDQIVTRNFKLPALEYKDNSFCSYFSVFVNWWNFDLNAKLSAEKEFKLLRAMILCYNHWWKSEKTKQLVHNNTATKKKFCLLHFMSQFLVILDWEKRTWQRKFFNSATFCGIK